MKGKNSRYTFVFEFLGGTYVRQTRGDSPELALRSWLRLECEEDEDEQPAWAAYRTELMRVVLNQRAVPIEGCQNVWCMSGEAAEHLFLIHIVGSDGEAATGRSSAEAHQLSSNPWRRERGARD